MKSLTMLSWNVNGIRAIERKGFLTWLADVSADIVCIQETKVSDPNQLSDAMRQPEGFHVFWNCAKEKKGYSGVATFSKLEPLRETSIFDTPILCQEGRMQQIEFEDFILLNIYFPNGGQGPVRLKYKLKFYEEFLNHVKRLKAKRKKVMICGDVNTAHHEIDLAHPKENVFHSGFMPVERAWLDTFQKAGLIDTFRQFHPNEPGQYTWWDMRTNARPRDIGWRIDYFYVTSNLKSRLKDAFILKTVMGSDHCPVGIDITI